MLVLTRKVGDKIVVPGLGITIEVVRITGNRARIGVDAPATIKVLRSEVLDREKGREVA